MQNGGHFSPNIINSSTYFPYPDQDQGFQQYHAPAYYIDPNTYYYDNNHIPYSTANYEPPYRAKDSTPMYNKRITKSKYPQPQYPQYQYSPQTPFMPTSFYPMQQQSNPYQHIPLIPSSPSVQEPAVRTHFQPPNKHDEKINMMNNNSNTTYPNNLVKTQPFENSERPKSQLKHPLSSSSPSSQPPVVGSFNHRLPWCTDKDGVEHFFASRRKRTQKQRSDVAKNSKYNNNVNLLDQKEINEPPPPVEEQKESKPSESNASLPSPPPQPSSTSVVSQSIASTKKSSPIPSSSVITSTKSSSKPVSKVASSNSSTANASPIPSTTPTKPKLEELPQSKPLIASPSPSKSWAQALGKAPDDSVQRKTHKSAGSVSDDTLSKVAKVNGSLQSSSAPLVPMQKQSLGYVLKSYDLKKVQNRPNPVVYSRGFINTGNICFMNSILQALIHCKPFNQMIDYIRQNSIAPTVSKTPLLDALINMLNEFSVPPQAKNGNANTTNGNAKNGKNVSYSEPSIHPISPEEFYETIRAHPKFKHYKRGHQEDAEEFLGYLLEALNDEFTLSISSDVKPPATTADKQKDESKESDEWQEVGKNNKTIQVTQTAVQSDTPITKLFGGQIKSILNESTQKNPSITRQPFQQVQLDISDATVHSIEDAFINLTTQEHLQYSAKGEEVTATKQLLIDSMPQVLIIHLKRFAYAPVENSADGYANGSSHAGYPSDKVQKISKPISFPEHLTIPKTAVTDNVSIPGCPTYSLCGVVYHHGPLATSGHYTVDVKSCSSNGKSDDWINIDDIIVSKTNAPEKVAENNGAAKASKVGVKAENTKTAYILFYVRD